MARRSSAAGAAARPTLEDVARHAGVSRQTVSNVLNSPDLVRPETLSRVQQAIDELDYRPNLAARRMRTHRSHLLAMRMEPLRDGINGVVLDRFLHALTEHAQALGYRIMLFTAQDDAGEIDGYEQLIAAHEIDAFVLSSTHHGDRRTAWLRERGLRFVTFGRPWGDEEAHDWVDVDGAVGTAAATTHLLEQGHRRIGFLGWPQGSGVGDDRRAGWARSLAEHGLTGESLDEAVPDAVENGLAAAGRLLDRPDPVTAVVCASDSLAVGALGAVHERGLVPGRDVAIVGFDDTVLAQALGLSSVAQPIDAVARACVRRLVALLDPTPSDTESTALLAPSLVVRASSTRSPEPTRTSTPAPTPTEPGSASGTDQGAPA
ncbi:MAG: LacI family DNA-binding transcriptional regulator [Angustibacter sp.]